MRLTTITAAVALMAGAAFAGPVDPNAVQYSEYGEVEQSLTGQPGNADNGRKIMITKSKGNCIACHAVTALLDAPFHGDVGPTLDGIGSIRNAAELRGIVANAKMTFDGTVMPAFYKTSGFIRPGNGYTGKAAEGDIAPILSAQEIEDVVAYLLTLQDS